LFGNSAGAHHLVNVLFHITNAVLLFLVLNRMMGLRRDDLQQPRDSPSQKASKTANAGITATAPQAGALWPSAVVAALFAWHPLHVESVAWISERKDVLSTFFGLLTLIAYTRYVASAKWPMTGLRSEASARQAGAMKKSLVQSGISRHGSRVTRHASLFYWLALIFFALGLMSKPMLVTWPFVLLLLDFWPLNRIRNSEFGPSSAVALLWRVEVRNFKPLLVEKGPFFALAFASSAITFLALRGSGTMSSASYLPISERAGNALVSYVRYLGKMIWPEHLAFFYPYHTWAAWQVAGSAALLALITVAAVWQSRRRPFLIMGWLWFLGTLVPVIGLVQVGIQAMGDRYSYIPLIGPFVMMVWSGKELVDRRPSVKFICGTVTAAALAACLVMTSLQVRYWRNSETLCRHALDVTTHNVMVHFLLGKALMDEGKINESVPQLNEALEVTPRFAMQITPWFGEIHCELAMACESQGKIQEAIDHYHEAIRSSPDQPEAFNNLAWLLATCPDPRFRNGADAVRLAERACEVTHYQKTIYLGTLAAAYAETGRFDEAVATVQRAIALAEASGEQNLLQRNRELLELYRARRAYHGS